MGKVEVTCEYCGALSNRKQSVVKRNRHNFCNCKCRDKWQSKEYKGKSNPNYKGKIKVRCDNCEKIIERKPSQIKRCKHHFCNRKCQGEWQSKEGKGSNNRAWNGGTREVSCDNCGKSIEMYSPQIKRSKHHFCNKKCYGAWRRRELKGSNNPNWKGGIKIQKLCPVCGKEFEVLACEIKHGKGKYCSKKCARQKQKIPKHHTKPERIFKSVSKKNNLPFKYTGDGSFWIGDKPAINPDFIHLTKKIVVEIFSYWHDPLRRHCKVRYSATYEGRKKILKRYGYKLIVFWQEDLEREDAEQFVLHTLREEGVIK